MTEVAVLDLAQRALWLTLQIALPLLFFGLVAGVVVSVFQAMTQIHEMTLSFVPKILAVAVALILLGPWMLNQMVTFTTNLLAEIPKMIG